MAWYKDSEGHAKSGHLGGVKQGKKNNPANFANNRALARKAGRKGGRISRKN
jgi:general stress protein YciG